MDLWEFYAKCDEIGNKDCMKVRYFEVRDKKLLFLSFDYVIQDFGKIL